MGIRINVRVIIFGMDITERQKPVFFGPYLHKGGLKTRLNRSYSAFVDISLGLLSGYGLHMKRLYPAVLKKGDSAFLRLDRIN